MPVGLFLGTAWRIFFFFCLDPASLKPKLSKHTKDDLEELPFQKVSSANFSSLSLFMVSPFLSFSIMFSEVAAMSCPSHSQRLATVTLQQPAQG